MIGGCLRRGGVEGVVGEPGDSCLEGIEVDFQMNTNIMDMKLSISLMWLFLVSHVIDRYTCLSFRSTMTGSHHHAENNQA
jgi:hypothetical protein